MAHRSKLRSIAMGRVRAPLCSIAVLFALGAAGCSSGDDDGEVPQFATVYGTILSTRCTYCHSGTGPGLMSGKLDMSTEAAAYDNLVGVTAAGSSCDKSGLLRVDPGNAVGSLLFLKVNGKLASPTTTSTLPCGDPMPDDMTVLTQNQVDVIQDWINEGAHR